MAQTITKNSAIAFDKFSVSAPFVAAFDWLIAVGEKSGRGRAIAALSDMTDAQLKAKGTTRRDEAMRIMGASVYL